MKIFFLHSTCPIHLKPLCLKKKSQKTLILAFESWSVCGFPKLHFLGRFFNPLCHVMIKCPGATTVRVNCTCLKRGAGVISPSGAVLSATAGPVAASSRSNLVMGRMPTQNLGYRALDCPKVKYIFSSFSNNLGTRLDTQPRFQVPDNPGTGLDAQPITNIASAVPPTTHHDLSALWTSATMVRTEDQNSGTITFL